MENIIWYLLDFIFSVINFTMLYFFISAFLKTGSKINISGKITVILIIFTVNYITMLLTQNGAVISSVTILGAFFIALFCFKAKVLSASIASLFAFLAGATSEIIAIFIITNFQDISVSVILENNLYRAQGRSLTFMIFIIILALTKNFMSGSVGSIKIRSLITLCILPVSSAVFLQNFSLQIVETAYVSTIYDITLIMYVTIINALVFVMLENLIRQNEKKERIILLEAQNSTYSNHIKHLIDRNEHIQRISHDFKQQLQILYILCKEQKYEKLLGNLEELSNSQDRFLLIDTDNLMLDCILIAKIIEAENNKINFSRKIDVAPNLEKLDEEICVLMGNALDNAIEACNRSTNEKFIGLEVVANTVQFLLHITNSVGVKPKKQNGKFITWKKDKISHGIGFQSITKTCERRGGKLIYEYDEKRFNIWVVIPFT